MANLTGASQLDSGGIPTGSVKVPGVTLLKAIQGGNVLCCLPPQHDQVPVSADQNRWIFHWQFHRTRDGARQASIDPKDDFSIISSKRCTRHAWLGAVGH